VLAYRVGEPPKNRCSADRGERGDRCRIPLRSLPKMMAGPRLRWNIHTKMLSVAALRCAQSTICIRPRCEMTRGVRGQPASLINNIEIHVPIELPPITSKPAKNNCVSARKLPTRCGRSNAPNTPTTFIVPRPNPVTLAARISVAIDQSTDCEPYDIEAAINNSPMLTKNVLAP